MEGVAGTIGSYLDVEKKKKKKKQKRVASWKGYFQWEVWAEGEA